MLKAQIVATAFRNIVSFTLIEYFLRASGGNSLEGELEGKLHGACASLLVEGAHGGEVFKIADTVATVLSPASADLKKAQPIGGF